MNPIALMALALGGYIVYTKMKDGTLSSTLNTLTGSTSTVPSTDPAVQTAVAAANAAGVPITSVQQQTQQVAVIPPGGSQPVTQSYTVTTIGTNPGNPAQGIYVASDVDKARMRGQYRPNPPTPSPGSSVGQGVMQFGQGLDAYLGELAQGRRWDNDGNYRMEIPAWNYYRTLYGSGMDILPEEAAGDAWGHRLNQEEYLTFLANPAAATAQYAGTVWS